MSYLDDSIALVRAQIRLLAAAASWIADKPGPVADVGLGNGRTYDHLREHLPHRDIYAFDTSLKAATASVPPADKLILGDIRETSPHVLTRMAQPAVLVHCDIASGDPTSNLARSTWLPGCLDRFVADGAIVISRLPLDHPRFAAETCDLLGLSDPEALPDGELFLYRVERAPVFPETDQ